MILNSIIIPLMIKISIQFIFSPMLTPNIAYHPSQYNTLRLYFMVSYWLTDIVLDFINSNIYSKKPFYLKYFY